MTAPAFWNALEELRRCYHALGASEQARIDLLVSSIMSAPRSEQRSSLLCLIDVADSSDQLRCLLLALLPPDVADA